MNKPLLYIFLLGLIISQPTIARADHYEYSPQDPAAYNYISGGDPEMWMYEWWYIYSIYDGADSWRWIDWKADANIRTEFGQAITEWSTIDGQLVIDWHDWRDANNIATTIDLEGKVGACPGVTIAHAGCFKVLSWVGVTPGNANRWATAEIYVNLNNVHYPATPKPTWTSTSKKLTIAHELGHAYGLHERYRHTGSPCNNDEFTIMDAGIVSSNTIAHCDGIAAPTVTDKNRISALYVDGFYDLQTASWNGSNLVATWKDQTWSDWSLRVEYQKWNGTYWETKEFVDELLNIAAHQTPANRTITSQKNVKASWGSGYYKVCGYGWNGTRDNGFIELGGGECSGSIFVL